MGACQRLPAAAAAAAVLAVPAGIACAQDASADAVQIVQPMSEDDRDDAAAIVVTGTILRRTDKETPSPITTLTAADLARRGVSTISELTQTLAANNSGTLTNSFTAQGAFAAGASAPSLRGLTTDSTLVLFDGLRGAYYPLADDGVRNFVDTNTIPIAIVDQVQVLQDGASSTYGADAVAGVINIITKKEIRGLQANFENGVSAHGDDGHQRLSLTYGWGDLAKRGFNLYVSGEYQRDAGLHARDRGFPYNSDDYTRLVGRATGGYIVHGTNGNVNGLDASGEFPGLLGASLVAEVAPVGPDGDQIGKFNPIAGTCGPYTAHHKVDLDDGIDTICEYNPIRDSNDIEPKQVRAGLTGHLTVDIGSQAQAYAMFTYYQSRTRFALPPASIRAATQDGLFNTGRITVPAILTAGPNAGQPNPNDPFAAAGEDALIYYRFGDIRTYHVTRSRTYRGAAGIKGGFGDGWSYAADLTGMNSNLLNIYVGEPYIAGMLAAIADGSYNFVDPSVNSAAVRERIAPTLRATAASKLYQAQSTLSKTLFHLPGGAVNLGFGAAIRYEAVNDPSANPVPVGDITEQYFRVNRFAAIGHRYVESGYFEIDMPLFRQIDMNGSGRFDHYSTGFSHFSPKIGVKVTPIRQIAFRATYSRGFRVPSFSETAQLPSTSYSRVSAPRNSPFALVHLLADGRTPDAYVTAFELGTTTAGNPNLRPETSRNITAGVVVQPFRWLAITADYYDIVKRGIIVSPLTGLALSAYFNGNPIPDGYKIVLDEPDLLHPDAPARPLLVESSYTNANRLSASGVDIEVTARVPLASQLTWSSRLNATYLARFDEILADGTKLHFAGTLGPYDIGAGSGSPRWRANWQNTFTIGRAEITATLYYTSGYRTTAEDEGGAGTANDCLTVPNGYYDDGVTPIRCHVRHFLYGDLNTTYRVTDKFSLYVNIDNVTGARAPFDPVSYGGHGYNASWSEAGVVGRYFEMGARISL